MKSKIAIFNLNSKSTFSAILLSLTLMVATFWVSPAAAQKYVTDPSTGKVVVAPKYGGTITYVDFGGSAAGAATDYYVIGAAVQNVQLFQEKLGFGNWAIDRDVWSFNTQHLPLNSKPQERQGVFGKSWTSECVLPPIIRKEKYGCCQK